jgi:hypothetical protein
MTIIAKVMWSEPVQPLEPSLNHQQANPEGAGNGTARQTRPK